MYKVLIYSEKLPMKYTHVFDSGVASETAIITTLKEVLNDDKCFQNTNSINIRIEHDLFIPKFKKGGN